MKKNLIDEINYIRSLREDTNKLLHELDFHLQALDLMLKHSNFDNFD